MSVKKRIRQRKPKARRSWVINPATRVKDSGRKYKRQDVKKEILRVYENGNEKKETQAGAA